MIQKIKSQIIRHMSLVQTVSRLNEIINQKLTENPMRSIREILDDSFIGYIDVQTHNNFLHYLMLCDNSATTLDYLAGSRNYTLKFMANQRNMNGLTPLALLCSKNEPDSKLFDHMVSEELNSNLRDNNLNSPLSLLIRKENITLALKYALHKDYSKENISDQTEFDHIITYAPKLLEHKEFIPEFFDGTTRKERRSNVLTWLAKDSQMETSIMRKIIKNYFSGFHEEDKTQSCIHFACKCGNFKFIEIVFSVRGAGNEFFFKDRDGYSPLALARMNGHCDLVKFLVERVHRGKEPMD